MLKFIGEQSETGNLQRQLKFISRHEFTIHVKYKGTTYFYEKRVHVDAQYSLNTSCMILGEYPGI